MRAVIETRSHSVLLGRGVGSTGLDTGSAIPASLAPSHLLLLVARLLLLAHATCFRGGVTASKTVTTWHLAVPFLATLGIAWHALRRILQSLITRLCLSGESAHR